MTDFSSLLQFVFAGLGTGGIYALVAVGFNIIFKSTGALNFAQGEWVMMGGMFAAFALQSHAMPVWMACVLAVAAVAVVGWASDFIVVRRIRDRSALTITLITVGIAIASKSLIMLTLGKNPHGYSGLSGDAMITIMGAGISVQTLWILAITIVLMLAAHYFFAHTRYGIAMRAAAANPDAAALVGISNTRIIAISFTLAALFGGLAGAIITPLTLMSYDNGTVIGFKGFSAAMLGGLGNLYGAAIGGVLLGLLESLAGGYISSQFKDGVAFFVLLAVLVFRPQGLLGRADVTKV